MSNRAHLVLDYHQVCVHVCMCACVCVCARASAFLHVVSVRELSVWLWHH